jgi:predicted TIM-barrel fold metal-dependent hydrolase
MERFNCEERIMAQQRVITIEEHFWTPELRDARGVSKFVKNPEITRRMDDLGALRIQEMDDAGIDMQVLSENAPAAQGLEPEAAVRLTRISNDLLHSAISAHPHRFAGFATLPTSDPKAACDELERCIVKLGFKGAMIMGLSRGRFLDEKEFWPIFEQAAALDVPIYFHPSWPHPAVVEAYMKGYPSLIGAALGFTIETMTQSMRLIVSGVLDKYPELKIILGHLGETLPFLMWRTDSALSHVIKMPRIFSEYMRHHFWVTTSGAFQHTALTCTIAELGVERVIFSVDWPFQSNREGRNFIDTAPINEGERELIYGENARKLLKL